MQMSLEKNQLALSVLVGIIYFVAGIVGGQMMFAVTGLVVMLVFALALWLLRGRSEAVKGLLDHRDEWINSMDLTVKAYAGGVLLLVIIGAFVVDVARGNDGAPYYWLGFRTSSARPAKGNASRCSTPRSTTGSGDHRPQ